MIHCISFSACHCFLPHCLSFPLKYILPLSSCSLFWILNFMFRNIFFCLWRIKSWLDKSDSFSKVVTYPSHFFSCLLASITTSIKSVDFLFEVKFGHWRVTRKCFKYTPEWIEMSQCLLILQGLQPLLSASYFVTPWLPDAICPDNSISESRKRKLLSVPQHHGLSLTNKWSS